MTAVLKFDAIEKALTGKALNDADLEALQGCLKDYRTRIRLGNGFHVTYDDLLLAFKIIYDDIDFMTARRREHAIKLLIRTGARGYRHDETHVSAKHPTITDRSADGYRVPVTDNEKTDAMQEAC